MPWLAAEGPLAYSPEAPPDRDYYFQYNRVLPGIFADNVNLRRHLYFGAGFKDHVRDVLAFWALARQGCVARVAICMGDIGAETVTAPLAVYRMVSPWRDEVYVFIQHGSYQIVSIAQQPRLESGEVLVYRGLQNALRFGAFPWAHWTLRSALFGSATLPPKRMYCPILCGRSIPFMTGQNEPRLATFGTVVG